MRLKKEVSPPEKTERLTSLYVIKEAENVEPQLQNKRGKILKIFCRRQLKK